MRNRDWLIWEEVTNIFGEKHDEFVGRVEAATKESALNKARKLFKVDRGGVPERRRNADNFKAF